jgi:hypothetical protein
MTAEVRFDLDRILRLAPARIAGIDPKRKFPVAG